MRRDRLSLLELRSGGGLNGLRSVHLRALRASGLRCVERDDVSRVLEGVSVPTKIAEIVQDDEGRWWASCSCGWASIDEGEHGRQEAPSGATGFLIRHLVKRHRDLKGVVG